jgi:prophage antirepressor-like protein
MLRVLGAGEKQLAPHSTRGKLHHKSVIIAESGLYKLIMRSGKPEAKPFQNWVTQVVLPAIRNRAGRWDGGYIISGENSLAFLHIPQ